MPSKSLIILLSIFIFPLQLQAQEKITVGSKRFTENYIVAEIFAQLLESEGFTVRRRLGLGGTVVAYNALKTQEIDVYPEYTGTITEAIIKNSSRNFDEINKALTSDNTQMLQPLGFDNSYCLVMKKEVAAAKKIKTISDLSHHPSLHGGLSAEFIGRSDGWKNLKKIYSLKNKITSIELPLTYQAVDKEKVSFAEAYSTEPLIKKLNFIVLADDKEFFPKYAAIPLVHKNVSPKLVEVLNRLQNTMDNTKIIALNQKVVDGNKIEQVANDFLIEEKLVAIDKKQNFNNGLSWKKLLEQTRTHMLLTSLAVLLATLVAVPFASLFAHNRRVSQAVLGLTGILQTIPSIALLAFMIPLFGIGFKPAIVGLFIYSLLPILRNTHTAMNGIDPRIITAAKGIGLYPMEIFLSVKLPLAFPTILAGIRTATVLNIGTATLAAFIGAGGLGEPIVAGLALNDNSMILQGAIPAALLAIFMDGLFSLADRLFSKHV